MSWLRDAMFNLIIPLLPRSLEEILLFIVTVVLIIVIIDLFVYTNIQRRIRNESRCYKENKESVQSRGVYSASIHKVNTVAGENRPGAEIATISYDMGARTYTIEDACLAKNPNKGGPVTPVILDIPVYDFENKRMKTQQKTFQCPDYVGAGLDRNKSSHIMYTGYEGIKKAMIYGDKSFFEQTADS